MCFNAPVSMSTFLIGSALNTYLYMIAPNTSVKIIALFWQYTLFMQLLDFFSWTSDCPSTQQTISSKLSYIFNVTQPLLLLFIALAYLPSLSFGTKVIALVVAWLYMAYIYTYSKSNITCVKNLNACGNLDYAWWWDMPYGSAVYLFTSFFFAFLLLPTKFAFTQMAYVVVTLILSWTFYNCGTPSVWCFFQVFAPIYTMLTMHII